MPYGLHLKLANGGMYTLKGSEQDEISRKASGLRKQAIEVLNSDITNTGIAQVHREPDVAQTFLPQIAGDSLRIQMSNLSLGNRLLLVFVAIIGLAILAFFLAVSPLPAALTKFARGTLALLVTYAAYTWIFGIEFSEINFASGTITQYRRFNKLFQPKSYKLGDYSLVTSSFVGRGPNWVSVYLSGTKGRLEIGRYDPGSIETKFDSVDAIRLRNLLVSRLKIRDLGLI